MIFEILVWIKLLLINGDVSHLSPLCLDPYGNLLDIDDDKLSRFKGGQSLPQYSRCPY